MQDIDNKSTRLLKLGIPHTTFHRGFWVSDGMGLGEALAICKWFKFKDWNAANYYKKRCKSRTLLGNLGLEDLVVMWVVIL